MEKTPEQLLEERVARGELPSEEDLRAVASGREPRPWRQVFNHPIHGDLEFEMRLPRARDLAQLQIEMDNQLGNLNAEPRGATMLLVAAIAGMKTLITLPVIHEEREESEDPDDPREKVTKVYYDPENELNEAWLVDVWTHASTWRQAFIMPGALTRLGKSSGRTRGSDSSTRSAAPTASPSTTPA